MVLNDYKKYDIDSIIEYFIKSKPTRKINTEL